MQIQVVSKGIDVSDALREQILSRVEDGVSKYFNRPGEAYVSIPREGIGFRVECSLHLPSGAMLQARGEADDAYKALHNSFCDGVEVSIGGIMPGPWGGGPCIGCPIIEHHHWRGNDLVVAPSGRRLPRQVPRPRHLLHRPSAPAP